MDCNLFPAGERILADIESIFKKDLKLNEFVITLVEMNENKSPVNHMDHCLCLESWCVPYLYNYTHIRLKDLRKQKKRDLSGHNKLLIGALLLNPDVTLFWNMRRELVTNLRIDPQFELQFTSVILSRKPKSPEVFSYRKWLLAVSNSVPLDPVLLANEFQICELAANRYHSNYSAWNHRIWCLELVSDPSIYIEEWLKSRHWVSSHVSDYSGFHYRQKVLQYLIKVSTLDMKIFKKCNPSLIKVAINSLQQFLHPTDDGFVGDDYKLTTVTKKILKDSKSCKLSFESIELGLIASELLFNTDLLVTFPGHEAIWCHRRFIIYVYKKCISELKMQIEKEANIHKDSNGVPVEKDPKIECISESLLQRLIQFEEMICIKFKTNFDSVYSDRHSFRLKNLTR